MKKRDYSAIKFDVAEALGEWMNCLYLKKYEDGELQHDFIHHREADGVAAITTLLEKEGHKLLKQPGLKHFVKPPLFKRLMLLKRFLKLTSNVNIRWKKERRDITGVPEYFAVCFFTQEETLKIEEKAKSVQAGLNSWLLYQLDQAVKEQLLKEGSERKWISPVNMRPAETESPIMGNYSASIIVNFLEEDFEKHTPQWIHNSIRDYFKDGLHWGSQIYSNMARFIGFKGTLKVAKGIKEVGTGVFSNLGNWPTPETELNPKEKLVSARAVLAPATQILPVAATAWNWEGRLAITLQLHPSLNATKEELEQLFSTWIQSLGLIDSPKDCHAYAWRNYNECPPSLIRTPL